MEKCGQTMKALSYIKTHSVAFVKNKFQKSWRWFPIAFWIVSQAPYT
jgi:hypothetical protein